MYENSLKMIQTMIFQETKKKHLANAIACKTETSDETFSNSKNASFSNVPTHRCISEKFTNDDFGEDCCKTGSQIIPSMYIRVIRDSLSGYIYAITHRPIMMFSFAIVVAYICSCRQVALRTCRCGEVDMIDFVALQAFASGNRFSASSFHALIPVKLLQQSVALNPFFNLTFGRLAVLMLSLAISLLLGVTSIFRDFLYHKVSLSAMQNLNKGQVVTQTRAVITTCIVDIVECTWKGFTEEISDDEAIKMRNEFYKEIDKIAERHEVFKVETKGNAYIVTSGTSDKSTDKEGAAKVALFALDVMQLVNLYDKISNKKGRRLVVRAGINSGPVVGCTVEGNTKQFRYNVFGDSLSGGAWMEMSPKQKIRIQCSDVTYGLLRDAPSHTFDLVDGGKSYRKVDDEKRTWWLNGLTKRGLESRAEITEKLFNAATPCKFEKHECSTHPDCHPSNINQSQDLLECRQEEQNRGTGSATEEKEDLAVSSPKLVDIVHCNNHDCKDAETEHELHREDSLCSLSSSAEFKGFVDQVAAQRGATGELGVLSRTLSSSFSFSSLASFDDFAAGGISHYRDVMRQEYCDNWFNSDEDMQWTLRQKMSFAAETINHCHDSLRAFDDSFTSKELDMM